MPKTREEKEKWLQENGITVTFDPEIKDNRLKALLIFDDNNQEITITHKIVKDVDVKANIIDQIYMMAVSEIKRRAKESKKQIELSTAPSGPNPTF